MKKSTLALLLSLVALFLASPAARAADHPAAAKPATFIYVLRLVERLHDDKAWTDTDKECVGRHFQRLKEATASGRVAFAGRTLNEAEHAFGIVIFEAESAEAAKVFAETDPAVTGGAMTVEVFPFALVLQRAPKA